LLTDHDKENIYQILLTFHEKKNIKKLVHGNGKYLDYSEFTA